MRLDQICLCILLLSSFVFCSDSWDSGDDYISLFHSWKYKHGKKYSNEFEEKFRMSLFIQEAKRVEKENQNPNNTYKLALNQFSDMIDREIAQYTKSFIHPEQEQDIKQNQTTKDSPKNLRNLQNLPESLDWQEKLFFLVNQENNPLVRASKIIALLLTLQSKDQGQCGSCWAFAASKLATYRLAIDQNDLQSFSEQQIIDCVNKSVNSNYLSDGCQGGYPSEALSYAVSNGLYRYNEFRASGQEYSALFVPGGCYFLNFIQQNFPGVHPYYKPNRLDFIPGNEQDIINALQRGPLVAALNASNWSSYGSGIFNNCGGDYQSHGVVIVGYTPDYWIVQNSWGTSWGENGLMKLARNNNCNFPYYTLFQV